ncbi:hypothetical protein EVAR_46040_1 [Eumeta japonica]|uniref:ZP domain-containing protein n=1 Tax=Eumeta variegata TaxID=151549 RepID=A0A4C1XDM6_EUMVA|nr:hypothetical protein EVAR_46040_1 [Eumeta japonica]
MRYEKNPSRPLTGPHRPTPETARGRATILDRRPVPQVRAESSYPIPSLEAGNALVTSLGLRVSMGGGVHQLSDGSPPRLPFDNAIKKIGPHEADVMRIAALFALLQLSLATAEPEDAISGTLTAAELNLKLAGENALSPFYEASAEDTGVNFVRGARAVDSPLTPDVEVDCASDYFDVTVEFPDVFDGIIYSKGYYHDPKCRYVPSGGSQNRYSFRVPLNDCGSRPLCNACGTVDNILIIQTDDFVQGSYDVARKISCARTSLEVSTGREETHTLKLRPFMVDMLEVVAVPEPAGSIECWMDIQRGVYPNVSPLKDSIKIGEYLTILVYLKDTRNQFNLKIHDCWAYDTDDYNSPKANRIQLTDKEGCPKKKKLIDIWQKTTNTGKSGASLIAYSKLSAFRFPENDQVYLTCNVELCSNNCDSSCETEEIVSTKTPPLKCYGGSNEKECLLVSTNAPNCIPGSTDPRCIQLTTPGPPKCFPGSFDPRCPQLPPTTPASPNCYPGNSDPRCPRPTTQTPPNCYPGSPDPSCPQPPRPTTQTPPTYLPPTTTGPKCYPGSTDSRCPRPTTTSSPNCFPGSTDSRCPKITTTQPLKCFPGSNDPRCPRPTPTTAATPNCYPGSTDPRCHQITTPAPPKCFPGSNDPRCPKPTPTTIAPPNCYPGSTDPRCPQITTPASPKCFPGSNDPRCPRPTPTTTAPPNCYPGSTDPRCPQITTPTMFSQAASIPDVRNRHLRHQHRPIVTLEPTTLTPPTILPPTTTGPKCYPGSTDSRCPRPTTTSSPNCFPGSTDPRCPKITTPQPPKCFPGSNDPRCPRPTPTTTAPPNCYPGSTDPRCPQITTPAPPKCFPGSFDPRCPKPPPTTPASPNCYPGSSDPRCPRPTTQPPPKCYPGSPDPSCPQPPRPTTLTPPTYLPPSTTGPQCYPGSTDSRCPRPTTTSSPNCFPGSTDLRCPKITTPQPPKCFPGSNDPRCPRPTPTTTAPLTAILGTDPRCPQITTPAPPKCFLDQRSQMPQTDTYNNCTA